jgi:deoxycytidylate deaminase
MNMRQLEKISKRSTHRLYCHSALIFSGPRLLAIGYNHEHVHAEDHAIRRLKRLARSNNSGLPPNLHLISFMVKRSSGNMGNSLPCHNCMRAIRSVGIRKVTFFNGPIPCQMILY